MTIHSVTRKVVAGQMSAQRKPTVSIVIPVFNSAGCLPSLIESLENELPLISSDYEVLLVNDGSIDASWNVILNLSAKHAWIRGINLMRNYGQHNALLCGIRAAQNELTITMDDDQQNPPSELHKLVDKLMSENLDVVYGRPHKEEHGVFRDTASVLTKLVIKQTLGANNAPDVSAFRIFRTNIRNAFANYSSPAVNIDVLLTWGTSKFGTVVVTHRPREYQTSNYTLRKLIAHAVNMLTGFSTLPLQLASLNGLFLIAVGIVLLTYVLFRYAIWGVTVPGFAFLASIIIIFSGAQLMALGIIGEYVGRIYARTMDRPAYQIGAVSPVISDCRNANLEDILRLC